MTSIAGGHEAGSILQMGAARESNEPVWEGLFKRRERLYILECAAGVAQW